MAKPKLLDKINNNVQGSVTAGNLLAFNDNTGLVSKDSGINTLSLEQVMANNSSVLTHLVNQTIHVTATEKKNITTDHNILDDHIKNVEIHISNEEREAWNNKIDQEGALSLINANYSVFNKHVSNATLHVSTTDRTKWNNTYSKEEINNKFSQLEYDNTWKENVETFDDIVISYPSPQKGWTVSVNDTGIVYRFDGENWIPISANSIPLATHELDGKMSHEDKTKLDTVETKANYYVHPNTSSIRHVTDKEKAYWNAKAEDRLVTYQYSGLMSKEDKYKLDGIEEGATNFSLPDHLAPSIIKQDSNNRFVTDAQISSWSNKANNNLANETLDGLMSHYDKIKLNTVQANANYYTHPIYHEPSIIRQDENNRFVTDKEKLKWNSKLDSAPATSEANGYMSKEDKAKLDGIEEGANNYKLPATLPATIITQDPNNRFFTDKERIALENKKNKNSILTGTGFFNGTKGTVIEHEFENTSFSVSIIPTENPNGTVGEYWCIKTNKTVTVYCTGTGHIAFDYTLVYYD